MAFLIVFGAGTVLLGAVFIISIIITRTKNEGVANWPKVTGTVKQAFVYPHEHSTSSGTTTTYTPVVTYTYTIEGQNYESRKRNLLSFTQASLNSKDAAEIICARYPLDSEVVVYHNPDNPAQAILEKPKPTAHMAVLWYGVVCVLLGSGMMTMGILL